MAPRRSSYEIDMGSSSEQASNRSSTVQDYQRETSSTLHQEDSIRSASQTDLTADTSIKNQFNSSMKWFIDPIKKCCSTKINLYPSGQNSFDSKCLKPEFNQVNGLLKYFTFGVMFTNGILGFLIFIIGLWSSFEHRKMNHMPSVTTKNSTPLNPFSFLGIILCIFGLLFFILCIISCLGINRENLNLLRISLIGQFLTLVIFITSAILILIWGERIRGKISEALLIGLRMHYHADKSWTTFFDRLHMSYYCCGVYSFHDWNDNPHYSCTSANLTVNPDACSVPFTCCKSDQKDANAVVSITSLDYTCGMNILPSINSTINMNEIQERININGCFDEILPIIQQLVITAAIFMLLICIIIFVTIFLTCFLIFEIRLTKSEVERYCRKKKRKTDELASEKEEDAF